MITKREIFKCLKEKKLFSKFCLVVTTAFIDNKCPREMGNRYLGEIENLSDPSLMAITVKGWDIKYYTKGKKTKALVL